MSIQEDQGCDCTTHTVRLRYEVMIALCALIATAVYQFAQLEVRLQTERVYSRQVCNELARLTRELNRIPANDCARP